MKNGEQFLLAFALINQEVIRVWTYWFCGSQMEYKWDIYRWDIELSFITMVVSHRTQSKNWVKNIKESYKNIKIISWFFISSFMLFSSCLCYWVNTRLVVVRPHRSLQEVSSHDIIILRHKVNNIIVLLLRTSTELVNGEH